MARLELGSNPVSRLEQRLSVAEQALLDAIRTWCTARTVELYAVGGCVRDLLLGRPHLDLDLAMDGDVPELGRELGRQFHVEATVHEHFGTASLAGAGWAVDLSRTRQERYSYPGALPVVAPASIDEDLKRRDFTIHAIAVPLLGPRTAVIDPLGGITDLKHERLRVLHTESFRDDPTRILRLGRYAARLDFNIDEQTQKLARRDAEFLSAISGARIAHELERTFLEDRPEKALEILDGLHALRPISHILRITQATVATFERLRVDGCGRPASAEYLAALSAKLDRTTAQGLADRVELHQEEIAAIQSAGAAAHALRHLIEASQGSDPVIVVDALSNYPGAALRGAAAALGSGAQRISRWYLCELRFVRPALSGDDVLALGVPKGPLVGQMLRALRTATLRGELRDREQEALFVRAWLRKQRQTEG